MKPWKVICFAFFLTSLVLVRGEDAEKGSADAASVGGSASAKTTDSDTVRREAEAMSSDGFSAEELKMMESTGEKHQFQAEVNRLMDIIINSLYSNREIFLRELISNSADALDKIRFKALTKPELRDDEPLDIKLKFDKELKTITILDNGIGMTKDQLIQDLGVLAKSGTSDFLETAMKGGDESMGLIGQFGVGFYSVYLVSDKVTVVSKHNDDDQHVWESTANSVFTVAKDPRGNTLGKHGTEITLHLKEDAEEYLNEAEIEKYVKKYSQFINFPISLWTTRTETEEVPIEEEEQDEAVTDDDEADEDGEDDLDISEEDEDDEPAKPKTKTVEKEVNEWKRLNTVKAIWSRPKSEISEEEYFDFYKSLSKDNEDPAEKVHFVAEGEITFRSILYIPKRAPPGLYDRYHDKATNIKLFVRKVMISEEFDDFLPKYLSFVQGVVDSDDLPLNVSRETLAQSRVLKVMSKKIVRKVLEMLRKMAEREEDDDDDEDEDEEEEEEEEQEEKEEEDKEVDEGEEEAKQAYSNFWKEFGKSIKMGIISDRKNKSKLAKLLRFPSSKSEDKPISLESYVDRMKEDQKKIYYITGESVELLKTCPAVEKLLKLDYEVLYMADSIDEYVLQSLTEFDGVSLQSAAKEDLKFGNEDSDSFKEQQEEFKPLLDWLKDTLNEKVDKVKISNRLTTTPVVLVSSQYGWSGNMERVMKAQALRDSSKMKYQAPKKTLEINPRHPIITALKAKVEEDTDDASLKDISTLLYDTALLQNGFLMEEPQEFATIINRVVSMGLNVDPSAEIAERVAESPEEEEEEEEEAGEEAGEEADEAEE